MGGHGGLNILPQKSWNVYGQRNRQKVAEDEEAHREKEEADQKQRSKGDREVRLQVLRRQAGVEDDGQADANESQEDAQDAPVFEDEVAQPAEKHHINFWSSFEKSAHNPEREGRLLRFATCTLRYAEWVQEEKKKIARKRGDPKTQTSDARFDAQFAVMHGLAGQAPWYARPQQSMYATETVQQPELQAGTTKPGVPASRGHHESGGHTRAEPRSSRDHAGTHRGDRRERGPRKPKDAAQHASFDMASARSDLASMVGQGSIAYAAHSEKRSKEKDTVKHRHKDKHKHKHRGERSKSSGHRMREAADRSRSRSPKAGDKRSKSRRRDASSSGSDSDRERSRGRDAGTHRGSPAVAAQSTGVKNKFEHLRRERLEREKAEAQRARALLKQHYSR